MRAPLGAPRRLRTSGLAEDTGTGPALPGTRQLASPSPARLPRGGVIMPPGRVPGLPVPRQRAAAAGAAPADAGLPGIGPFKWLHHRNVSRRRPQPEPGKGRMKGECGGIMEFIPIDQLTDIN